MVDHPSIDAPPTFDFDHGDDGMPAHTARAFRSHYETQLEPSNRIGETTREIERVYRADPSAVVACSGGKDSMAVLALAADSTAEHRALHWDYGPALIPREIEREIVSNILDFAPADRLLVCNESMRVFATFRDSDGLRFVHQLRTDERLADWPSVRDTPGQKAVSRLAPRLSRSHRHGRVGRQILGLRGGESGSRARKLDSSGLYGESLGLPAAFPLREWSARDVWAYIVANDVPYPSHYDRAACGLEDGGPRAYEDVRMSAFFRELVDPGRMAMDGIAAWRQRDILLDNAEGIDGGNENG